MAKKTLVRNQDPQVFLLALPPCFPPFISSLPFFGPVWAFDAKGGSCVKRKSVFNRNF